MSTPIHLVFLLEPVGVHCQCVRGFVGQVVPVEVLLRKEKSKHWFETKMLNLEPGENILSVHVSEDTLVKVGAVTGLISLCQNVKVKCEENKHLAVNQNANKNVVIILVL